MEDICGQQGCHHKRIHIICKLEKCAVSVQSCRFNIARNWTCNSSIISIVVEGTRMTRAINLAHLEVSTSTHNLEVRNVHVATAHVQEDVTQRFYRLTKLIASWTEPRLPISTMAPISRVHRTNYMKYTT
jgi:hypothetical protein